MALRQAVRQADIKCAVLGDGATIVVDEYTVYEPDVTVQCGEEVDLDSITVPEPCILVEVLSSSTKGVDTGGKLAGYFQLASVQHYLVVDPEKHTVIHHYRMQDISFCLLHSPLRQRVQPNGLHIAPGLRRKPVFRHALPSFPV